MASDWLVPFDVRLCERFTHCSLCGCPMPAHGGSGFYVPVGPTLTIAVCLCAPCGQRPATNQDLAVKLCQRYAAWLEEP